MGGAMALSKSKNLLLKLQQVYDLDWIMLQLSISSFLLTKNHNIVVEY